MAKRAMVAAAWERAARGLRALALSILYHGHGRWCPVCERSSRRFRPAGAPRRSDACCPGCNSLERHRLAWLFFAAKTDLFDGKPKRMLHVGPEPCLASRLRRRLGPGYLSADLLDPAAMMVMDVTAIPFPEGSFDVIYCSHVLEHVADDRKALGEFFRVLARGGWAVLLVPINAERTVEDPTALGPDERREKFGQQDHVRRYGPDYVERLKEAGFQVEVSGPGDLCAADQIERLGLTAASGEIFCCSKP